MGLRRKRFEPNERPRPEDFRSWKSVEVHTTIEPNGSGWRWEAQYLHNGLPSCMAYSEYYSKRHPRPHTVAGNTKTQADAAAELAVAVDLMRSRIVAARAEWDHRQARRQVEVVQP